MRNPAVHPQVNHGYHPQNAANDLPYQRSVFFLLFCLRVPYHVVLSLIHTATNLDYHRMIGDDVVNYLR